MHYIFQMSMQFGLADMTGAHHGHPGALGGDKLGQHFDRYGLQWYWNFIAISHKHCNINCTHIPRGAMFSFPQLQIESQKNAAMFAKQWNLRINKSTKQVYKKWKTQRTDWYLVRNSYYRSFIQHTKFKSCYVTFSVR